MNELINSNKETIQQIIIALQGEVIPNYINVYSASLEKIVKPIDSKQGLRLGSLAVGPQQHAASYVHKGKQHTFTPYQVPLGQVHATINTTYKDQGLCATYMFEKTEEGLKLIGKDELISPLF